MNAPFLCLSLAVALAASSNADHKTSKPFTGAKANVGTVTFHEDSGKRTLTLSDDFKTPDTPAPHWQLVDASGKTYLLNRLGIKDNKMNKTITVPEFVPEIAKVQIWCSFAETLLGEAAFDMPVGACVAESTTTGRFAGVKANVGTATFARKGSVRTLTLSDDFKVPETPAPHWQVVDSKGNVFLLQRLMIKGDKLNKTIVLPDYVGDVAKVQIWCAFAEVLLGEAAFTSPVM